MWQVGRTALHLAAEKGEVLSLEVLINAKADLNLLDKVLVLGVKVSSLNIIPVEPIHRYNKSNWISDEISVTYPLPCLDVSSDTQLNFHRSMFVHFCALYSSLKANGKSRFMYG